MGPDRISQLIQMLFSTIGAFADIMYGVDTNEICLSAVIDLLDLHSMDHMLFIFILKSQGVHISPCLAMHDHLHRQIQCIHTRHLFFEHLFDCIVTHFFLNYKRSYMEKDESFPNSRPLMFYISSPILSQRKRGNVPVPLPHHIHLRGNRRANADRLRHETC